MALEMLSNLTPLDILEASASAFRLKQNVGGMSEGKMVGIRKSCTNSGLQDGLVVLELSIE